MHARYLFAILDNACDFGMGEDLDAASAGALGKGLGHIHRIGVAIARDMNTAQDIAGIEQRVTLTDFGGA